MSMLPARSAAESAHGMRPQGREDAEEACWICHDIGYELPISACACPRLVHPRCLGR